MKVLGKNGMGDILKKGLQFCFYGGIIALVVLPFFLHFLGLNLNASAIVIYPNGIVLLVIAYKFIKLFDSLKNNNPFCDENVKILRSAGIASFVGSLFWLFDLLYEIILIKYYDIVIVFVLAFLCILFLGVSIALYILSELLREATNYKNENDLTI